MYFLLIFYHYVYTAIQFWILLALTQAKFFIVFKENI